MSTKPTIKNAKGGPDRDLMAMETLLRFRSESVTDAKPSQPTKTNPQVQQNILPAVVPSAPVATAPAIAAAPSALQASISLPTYRQVSFSPHVNAKTAIYPQSPAFLPLEPAALSLNRTTMPVSPAVLSMGYPTQSKAPHAQMILKSVSSGSNKEDDARKAAIRKDEVEAALRSKPQRGRKRDNLSELERLELTRTRNREHAKSTRIRKKARYQELLDNEKKYEDLKTRGELNSQREQSVRQLVSVFNSIISGSKKVGDDEQPRMPRREKSVSFSDETLVASRIVSPGALDSVVESTRGFFFCVLGAPLVTESRGETTNGILSMDRFCQHILSRALDTYGARALGRIKFRMDTSNGGLALNEANMGFVNVQVVLTDKDLVLVDAILQSQFVPSSSKLESAKWCTLSEKFDELKDMDAESTSEFSSESLGLQTSFPSVVSLDPLVSAEDKPHNEKESASNVGMTI